MIILILTLVNIVLFWHDAIRFSRSSLASYTRSVKSQSHLHWYHTSQSNTNH